VPVALAIAVVLVAGVASAGLVLVHHFESRAKHEEDDGLLCARGASILPDNAAQPTVVAGPVSIPIFRLHISHTNAGKAAEDLARAHLSQHPWDLTSPDAPVLRCQSGSSTWLVDHQGHATRGPGA
jgi:hypothetical protein